MCWTQHNRTNGVKTWLKKYIKKIKLILKENLQREEFNLQACLGKMFCSKY